MSGLARAFAALMTASFVGSVTQVAKGKLAAIYLGPEGLGILNQLTGLWSAFLIAGRMGFGNGITRHLAAYHGDEDATRFREHLSSSAIFLALVAMALTAFGVVFSSSISNALFVDGGARADLVALILLGIPLAIAGQVYRALLNATRSASRLARARMGADVLGMVAFAVMIAPFGIRGAVLGFLALHAIYLLLTVRAALAVVGPREAVPKTSAFRWSEVRLNFHYAANGLFAAGIGAITLIVVSRWIIAEDGLAANGFYTSAIKVASVYLGGLYAAAFGYVFPTLTRAKGDRELGDETNAALTFYMYVLPPIIAALMATGDLMVVLLFSEAFLPVAALLLIVLPADLFRVIGETADLGLLARRHLAVSAALHALRAGLYLAGALWLLPGYGIAGVAIAYLAARVVHMIAALAVARHLLDLKITGHTALAVLRGGLLVGAAACIMAWIDDGLTAFAVCFGLGCVWLGVSFFDTSFRTTLLSFAKRT